MDVLLIGNDQTITLEGLSDEVTGDFLDAADVTATLKTKTGTVIAGPITLNYIIGSDGDYSGNLPNSVPLVNNRSYIVEIVAEANSFRGMWHFPIPAQYRQP